MKIENIILLYIFIIYAMTDYQTPEQLQAECDAMADYETDWKIKIKKLEVKKYDYTIWQGEEINTLFQELEKMRQKYFCVKLELDYYKKYKHLDFEKLGEDEDYWDCVVQEHNLKKCPCDNPSCSVTLPEGEEYIRFCKYFPRPKYDSDSD
tara:strand:+ start:24241 stop:24693 length:453 start_codon:yes stop_codon:yes gene_type:complete